MKNAAECAIDVFKKRFPFVDHTHGFNAVGLERLLHLVPDRLHVGLSICEVGSWLGGSARFFASFPFVRSVTCIDHWDRNMVENWVPGRHPEEWMDFMYEQFLANCLHQHDIIADKILPIRMESHEAALYLDAQCASFDLVYLDGAHRTEKALQDLDDYYPLAYFLCGDDWNFTEEPENVRGAVTRFAEHHGLKVKADANLWWYEA